MRRKFAALVALLMALAPVAILGANWYPVGYAYFDDLSVSTPIYTSQVQTIAVTGGGSGYTSPPTVTITGGGGTGATATSALTGDAVTSVTITARGTGYTSAPTIGFTGGDGTGATATATISLTGGSILPATAVHATFTVTGAPVCFSWGGGTASTNHECFAAGEHFSVTESRTLLTKATVIQGSSGGKLRATWYSN